MTTIELGNKPALLQVTIPDGDPFTESAVYTNDAGVATAWPAAPVLTLGAVVITATLSGTPANSVATWSATAAALAGVRINATATLRLAGVMVALGRVARPGKASL